MSNGGTARRAGSTGAKTAVGRLEASWHAIGLKEAALSRRWDELEARLVRQHGWARLSETAKRGLPAARELFELEAALGALERRRTALLRRLVAAPVTSRADIAGKLRALSGILRPDDQPLAAALLRAALIGLEKLGD